MSPHSYPRDFTQEISKVGTGYVFDGMYQESEPRRVDKTCDVELGLARVLFSGRNARRKRVRYDAADFSTLRENDDPRWRASDGSVENTV